LDQAQDIVRSVVGEQDKSRTVPDIKQDKEQNSEDLASAAARLGLTVETVRKRLQRGKIRGFKAPDGTWRVVLDKQDKRQDSPGQAAGQGQDKPGQDDAPLITALRDEVRFLRSQLRTRDEEVRRVHVLLQQEQQQVKALSDRRAPTQSWWRRLISLQR
jgi:hypothetical protein